MKKLLYLLIFISGLIACKQESEKLEDKLTNADLIRNPVTASGKTDTTKVAKIKFEETDFDFGLIKEGSEVMHEFKFTNVGKEVLLIRDARSSCGCTVPEWPEDPIPPGGTGSIKVRFDSSNRKGTVDKEVNIIANTNPFMTNLYITGKVE
jgi:hypothetical protein